MDLEDEVDSLRRENESLQRRLDRILTENERLRKEQEEALRSLMRQAAPFSKGSAKTDPK
jgi:predicted  nucleic acid-binding Zn-ribbon protein